MGDLEINSPRGVLSAKVNVGRLHVVSSTPQPGNIKLTSIFGLAVMDRNGKRLGPPQAHDLWGSVHIPGNSVKQRGTGADSMDLKVNFGEVDLHIEPARGGK